MTGRNRGAALPLLLLLLLALTALGNGTLLLARREMQVTWAYHHAVRAGEAAEAALRLGARSLRTASNQRSPGVAATVSSGESEDGLLYESEVRWLDSEFFLLEGTGGSRGWGGKRRRTWVGWSLDPVARLGAFQGESELGGALVVEGVNGVEVDRFLALPEGWPATACEEFHPVLDSLFRDEILPPIARLGGEPAEESGPGASIPPLGLLSGPLLFQASQTSTTASPFEGAGTSCPGGDGPVLDGTTGTRTLDQGTVCGLLAVEGDLRLDGSAVVQGLVLVGGDLILEGGALFEGMARIGGDIRLGPEAEMRLRACPALWALDGLPQLQTPQVPISGGTLNGY